MYKRKAAYSFSGGILVSDEKTTVRNQAHNVILENRKSLHISGVQEVSVFDENYVVMNTVMGELEVRGEGIHVSELSVGTGELYVEGKIVELNYRELVEKSSFWERLFG